MVENFTQNKSLASLLREIKMLCTWNKNWRLFKEKRSNDLNRLLKIKKYDRRNKNVNRWVARQSWENLPESRTQKTLSSPQILKQRERIKKLETASVSSVTRLCLTPCNPMDYSMPGFPVHHQLPELTQIHVHQVSDAIRPSRPLSSPSPSAFNLSQHQGLFQWGSSSHQVVKVLEFQFQLQSFQWIFRTDFL